MKWEPGIAAIGAFSYVLALPNRDRALPPIEAAQPAVAATYAGIVIAAGDQTLISPAEAVGTAVGAALSEIENTRGLPPGRIMGADTDLTFV